MVVTKAGDDFIVDGTSLSMMDNSALKTVAEMTDNRDLLLKLIHDTGWMIASAAADNPLLDSKVLDSLARDPSEPVLVHLAVAQSNHVSEDTLSFLARNDDNFCVRLALVVNKNTNTETLALMAKDGNPHVRLAVARNKNATVEILNLLVKDNNPHVRMAVANSQNTTVEVLALMVKDKDSRVRQAIARAMAKIMIENEDDNEKDTYAG